MNADHASTAPAVDRAQLNVVVGGTSHTGGAVARALLRRGARVRATGRSAERLAPLADAGAEPFVAAPADPAALTRAMADADVVYAMLQPGIVPDSEDLPGFLQGQVDALRTALAASPARLVVSLSGWGANYERSGGPLLGLRRLEAALDGLDREVVHVRAGSFMENLLPMIDSVRASGAASGLIRPDLPLPMIATEDVGAVVAAAMLGERPRGKRILEVHGPAARTHAEALTAIGERLGVPARYVQQTAAELRSDLLAAGFSAHVADLIVEMQEDIDAGRIRMLEPAGATVRTDTTLEAWLGQTV